MAVWAFTLDPGGVITTQVDIRSIIRNRRLHTELRPNVNKLTFRVLFTSALLTTLLDNDVIQLTVTKDGAAYFTGFLSPNYKTVIRDGQKYLELIAEDPTLQKLGKTIAEPLGWPGYYVCEPGSTSTSLVHVIAAAAGIALASGTPTISAIIPYVTVLPEDKLTWAKLLERILYEYNVVYHFNEAGHLVLSPAVNTGVVTTSATLTTAAGSANIRGELVIEKSPEKFDDIRVHYDLVELKTGIVLMQDTTGGNDANPANIVLEAAGNAEGKDYYPLSAKTGEVYSAWKSPEGYAIWVATSAALDATIPSGVTLSRALTNYYRKCSFAYQNTAVSQRTITKLRVTGNAYVIASQNTVRTSDVTGKALLEYDASYVFDDGYAKALVNALAQYYRYSDIKYKVRSTITLSMGQYVLVSDAIYAGIATKCRVVGIIEDEATPGGIVEYHLEGCADYTAATLVTEAQNIPITEDYAAWIVEYIFGRFASQPATPTENDPVDNISWFDTPPSGSNPIWMCTAKKDSFRDLIGPWSTPQQLSGDQGPIGPSGGSVVWAGSFADFPQDPIDSMAFYHTGQRKSYVFSPGTLTTFFGDSTLFGSSTLFAGGSWYVMAVDSPYMIAQYSANGSTWSYDPTGAVYMRMSSDGGTTWSNPVLIKGEDGDSGQGQVKGICFLRSVDQPSTPTGGSYASPTGTGWSDGIPADNNQPLWMSTRIFTSDGLSPQQTNWTTAQKVGTPSTGTKLQFSADGASWHDTPAVDDLYMRSGTSTDNGATWTYGGSVLIKGETGDPGPKGDTGDNAGRYLGALSADPTTGMEPFDFYFLTSGSPKKIRRYNGTAWSNVVSSDPQYGQYVAAALQDMSALALADGDDGFVFFSNLVARNLFSREITILPGGLIKADYIPGISGFQIKADGNAEFNDVKVRGEFEGEVNATKLVSTGLAPGDEYIFKRFTDATSFGPGVKLYRYRQVCGSGSVRINFQLRMSGFAGRTFQVWKITLAGTSTVIYSEAYGGSSFPDYQDRSFDVSVAEGDNIKFEAGNYPGGMVDVNVYLRNMYIKTKEAPGLLSWVGYDSDTSVQGPNPR
jgi:hypothetical protein